MGEWKWNCSRCGRQVARSDGHGRRGWRPRPPTLEELRAHHEAQASPGRDGEPGEGPSWWLVQDPDDFELAVARVDDPEQTALGIASGGCATWHWRPVTPEGLPCEWPACGHERAPCATCGHPQISHWLEGSHHCLEGGCMCLRYQPAAATEVER